MTEKRYKHLYGPVPSRRLGRSLGVDLVPFKVCSFDCIYCQLGRTTMHTARRDVYAPTDEILDELADKLDSGLTCDYITLAGSGEPTLHKDMGRIVLAIKSMTDIPLALLTNGSLLSDPEVRSALSQVDLVVPSLDAGDFETFEKVNRPCPEITFQSLVAGLKAFRQEYPGEIRLEVFLVAGINDSESQVQKIKAIIDEIGFDHIEINTATRPPVEEYVRAVDAERLDRLCKILGPNATVIAAHTLLSERAGAVSRDDILAMLARRPCTIEELAEGLNCHRWEVAKLVGQLTEEGKIIPERRNDKDYYQIKEKTQP
ncbi:MAG: radical SAM protein [Planctomycetota bacterium]|nr:radical SAM protein [Planctomycetota bacterium]